MARHLTAGMGGEIFRQSTIRVSGTSPALRALLLLLVLSWWPSLATAAPLVETGTDVRGELRTQDASYATGGLRSAGGINILGSIDSHRPTGAGAPCGHSGSTTAGKLHLRHRSGLFRAQGRTGRATHPDDPNAAAIPLCESLPFFATAPPSSR